MDIFLRALLLVIRATEKVDLGSLEVLLWFRGLEECEGTVGGPARGGGVVGGPARWGN